MIRLSAKLFLIFTVLSFSLAQAYDGKPQPLSGEEKPKEFLGIGITENLGSKVDSGLQLTDETGQSVTLAQVAGGKPFVLSLVYYSCPRLCNLHLNGIFDVLKNIPMKLGSDYSLIAVSFDDKENAALASVKKENYLKEYGMKPEGIHFLTATAGTIKSLSDSTGFKFKWNEESKEWAHASAGILISKDFTITRYMHGVQFEPAQFKLAILEAGQGKVGTFVDKVIWYCFRYDPHQSKYSLYVFRIVQVCGAMMVLLLAVWLIPGWLRSRKAI